MSAFESIISEYDNVVEIISDNGKQHSLAVTRDMDNTAAVFTRSKIMLGMIPMLPPLLVQQPVWVEKALNWVISDC